MPTADVTFVDKYIRDGQSAPFSLKKFYDTILVTREDNRSDIYRIPLYDIFIRYREQFDDCVQLYSITEKYFYKPKTLSLELYDTTEMWLALLRLNCMRNISEFTENIIKVYNPVDIKELIEIFLKREKKIS